MTVEKLRTALSDRYNVIREIGAGGMATVYLARDLRHDRDVALKLLKPELGAVLGPERFLSEIRVTAKLQHPNLLPLFDSGECEGQLYYVMPFVEGETLRSLLQRERQLPVREAIRIAVGIASALDYAHRHGVIHRDLKPENVLLQDGQPLVADLGIALAVSNAGGERVTQTGLSLGTPQYMSPEQATGERAIDRRSDIYSLGAVLYEMLTGEPPHSGATMQAVIARVLTENARRVRLSRPSIPPHVDAAIAKALEKVPADRFDSAKAFADVLEGRVPLEDEPVVAGSPSPRALARRTFPVRYVAALALATLLLLAGFALGKSRGRAAAASGPVTFSISTGLETLGEPTVLAVSPDGRRVVYVGAESGKSRLYQRNLDELESRPIAGTDGAEEPFFSPDGQWLAFFANGQLKRVQVDGKVMSTVVGNVVARPSWWATPQRIIVPTAAFTRRRSGLSEVSPSSGTVRPYLRSDTARGEMLMNPVVLPDGKTVMFSSWGPQGTDDDRIAIGALDDSTYAVLDFIAPEPITYVDGYALVLTSDTEGANIVALPVNLRRRRIEGEPVTLLESVAGLGNAAVSNTGTLAYVTGSNSAELTWDDGGGQPRTLLSEAREYWTPRISPDGRNIAFALPGGWRANMADVWTYNIAARTLSRLSADAGAAQPEWTPDGKSILFVRPTTAQAGIWIQRADGSGDAEQLHPQLPAGMSTPQAAVIARNGTTIALAAYAGSRRRDIYWFERGSTDSARALLTSSADEFGPRFSPDGKWLVYVSNESGSSEVYLRPFPGPGTRLQISSGGASEPVWSSDGRTVFYRSGQQLIAADVAMGDEPTVRSRRTVIRQFASTSSPTASYDVSRDGKSFLYPRLVRDDTKIVVIANWMTDVRKRLAEAKR